MRGWLAACVLGLLLAPAGAAAQWDDVREVEDAVWHDCLRSLPEGPLSRRTREGVVPIGIPEHQAELRTLRPRARAHWQGLLAFDSEAMAICRPALTAQVFSDQPRFTGGLIGLGIWSVYTIGAGIGSSLWPFTPAAASPASLPFLGAHFSGAPAWRVVGIRRALRRHADGESLRDALLAEVPKADGLGWFMGGASMAGGAYLMVLPSLIRGAIETQRGIPIAPGATSLSFYPNVTTPAYGPIAIIGFGFMIYGGIKAAAPLPATTSASITRLLRRPTLVPWGAPRGRGGVAGVALTW